jgi:single-stranded-DNA-specific exonuclease
VKPAPRHWQVADGQPLTGFSPLVGRILSARGFDDGSVKDFLARGVHHDPALLKGMREAVAVIREAAEEKQRMAIYGDFDADGVCACALLTNALRDAGADVISYIPNRMSEGYGLHAAALEELAGQGVQLVITVDCGTSSAEVALGRPSSMRLVITDHHLPLAPDGEEPVLAPADALINPKQPGDTYPFDGLAGAGVAFKLLQALEEAGVVKPDASGKYVGLAAIGTVSDMMVLRDENRTIVQAGLAQLNTSPSPGVAALLAVSGIKPPIDASDLGFGVGPRINAAGRMEDALLALQLLLAKSDSEAYGLAQQLNAQNKARQRAVHIALEQAEAQVAELPEDLPAIVLGDTEWQMGIVGLVAGRIAEKFARPTFVVSLNDTEAKGSARSASGVHLVKALDKAAHTLVRYGGHTLAAGFSLEAKNFEAFKAAVCAGVALQLDGTTPQRVFSIDSLAELTELTPALYQELSQLEPCGQGNPKPQLCVSGVEVVSTRTFGAEGQHIGVYVRDPKDSGAVMEAIAFSKPHLKPHLPVGRLIDLCFVPEVDHWNGQEKFRLRMRDIRPAKI